MNLILKVPGIVNVQGDSGYTPLFLAVENSEGGAN